MDAKITTLVLLGRTGNGKSATGNSILGRNAFTSLRSWTSSVTKECQLESRAWKDGRIINVIDTPGLFDISSKKEDIDRKIVECISLAKHGVHGFLLVISTQLRFTEEEEDTIYRLEMLFGPKLVKYMVLVFNGGDKLQKHCMTLEMYLASCPPSLKEIISRCNSRMLLFNNKKKSKNQITELLAKVDRVVADNGNQPYSNYLFTKAQPMTSELFHVRDKEIFYAEQMKQLKDMMEQNTCIMEERMQRVKADLEKQLEDAHKTAQEQALKQGLEARVKDLEYQLKSKDINPRKLVNVSQIKDIYPKKIFNVSQLM